MGRGCAVLPSEFKDVLGLGILSAKYQSIL